ncbi:MAG TPA: RNA methyltransferase [Chitinophagales bacterium]|jgi:TrmH family RNA methyltransferase|nr:RNA methyltransferase [Chitinophagales bacterium]HQV78193.1 RNA methyltransferase [Chitinophagales bacterium]HQW79390.1 RNA methyltransferase [Chitinophagales bacterium]HRB66175.1 RNA methyltransferase [Chitinophagales bacterium]
MLSQNDIKYINSLKIKKYRKKYAQFIAEGDKIIKELIVEGLEVVHIYTINNVFSNANVTLVSEIQLNKITALQQHHHSLAIFKIPNTEFQIKHDEWILLLDDIQDPGNMGTIIRTCDWFGVKKIICSDGCVDPWNTKVIQASMASIGRVQVVEADIELIISQFPFPVYGAVLNGTNYRLQTFNHKGFILIGNEGHGIRKELLQKISYPITIPRIGSAESLNAAIATALILDKL